MHETLAEDAEKSLLADRPGFDDLWIGGHFSASSEPVASPMMFVAALAPRSRLAFATGMINLPDHHPAMVAAEVAQFDHVTEGRCIMDIVPGGLAPGWEPFGNADATPRFRQHAAAAAERAAAAGRPGATPAVTGAAISV